MKRSHTFFDFSDPTLPSHKPNPELQQCFLIIDLIALLGKPENFSEKKLKMSIGHVIDQFLTIKDKSFRIIFLVQDIPKDWLSSIESGFKNIKTQFSLKHEFYLREVDDKLKYLKDPKNHNGNSYILTCCPELETQLNVENIMHGRMKLQLISSFGLPEPKAAQNFLQMLKDNPNRESVLYIDIDDTLYLHGTQEYNCAVIDFITQCKNVCPDLVLKIVTARPDIPSQSNPKWASSVTSILTHIKGQHGLTIDSKNIIFTNEVVWQVLDEVKRSNPGQYPFGEFSEKIRPKINLFPLQSDDDGDDVIVSALLKFGKVALDPKGNINFRTVDKRNFTKVHVIRQDIKANNFQNVGFIDDSLYHIESVKKEEELAQVCCIVVGGFLGHFPQWCVNEFRQPSFEVNLNFTK